MTDIQPLGGLDALFLQLESPQMPMHVGSMHLYEVAPRQRRGFLARVRKDLSRRLHLSPVFTRRLLQTPLKLANPLWIDDGTPVDIEYHVRHVELPSPGTRQQLEDCIADLHSQLMDRARPLWQFYVIDGLADGHLGFYAKVHHAAVDGKAAVVLARAMLDLSAKPPPVPPPRARPSSAPPPGSSEVLGVALSAQAKLSMKLLRMLPGVLKAGSGAAADAIADRIASLIAPGRDATPRDGLPLLAPRTRLNSTIDGQRAIATAEFPIDDARLVCAALGGTVNDVVLAICSAALREYLSGRGELPAQSLIAAVPVSLRADGDETQNTQTSLYRATLATDIDDAAERYAAIVASSASLKRTVSGTKSLLPMDFPSVGLPWVVPGIVSLVARARLADRIRPLVNLVISNVPGPTVPLYISGARMLTYYPLSISTHGMALNITVESYNGTLYFGLVACRRAVPDLHELAAAIDSAGKALVALAGAIVGPARKAGTVKKARATRPGSKRTAARRGDATGATGATGATKSTDTASGPAKRRGPRRTSASE